MIVLVQGKEAVLVSKAVTEAVDRLVGDGDRTLVLEELTEKDFRRSDDEAEVFEIDRLVDAAQTPPFLTDHRVVVARHMGRFSNKESVAALVNYLADPLPSSRLVLVWEAGADPKQTKLPAVPKSLKEALEGAGAELVKADIPGGKGAGTWLDAQLAESAVTLDARARTLVAETLGEDRSRVIDLIAVLEGTFGVGAKLTADEVEPYLGDSGGVPPWDLTDAIDKGDIPTALDMLDRMIRNGRHPFQLMFTLHGHYEKMLCIDGLDVDDKAAAEVMGTRPGFATKKLVSQSRRLGSDRIADGLRLVGQADLDMRGVKDWPDRLVVEVLVARLARLGRR